MSLDFSDQGKTADDESAKTAQGAEQGAPQQQPPAAAFGLIFQAPDPETRAPARTPERDDRNERDDRSGEDADQRGGSRGGREDAQGDQDEQDSGEGKGRRRRGGRGRRAKDGEGEADGGQESGSEDDRSDAAGDDKPARGKGKAKGRGGKGKKEQGDGEQSDAEATDSDEDQQTDGADEQGEDETGGTGSRRRRRRRRSGSGSAEGDDPPGTVTKVREPRKGRDEVTAIKGSTRLEAKKQRRREGREAGRRRTVITEAEFLARRESVERSMVVREREGRTQIGVLEDGVLVEHYVSSDTRSGSMAGNVYLGRVQNVLPSMEAAFVDIGRGRNAVLYAGEVNWDAAGMEGQPKRIENALKSGETVLVQVTKDPIGHKGARLTSQISLPGRYLVYVPGNSMTGISRKLPDTERARLKKILKEVVPEDAGVIVRTAAEGASEEELRADVERLTKAWEKIQKKASSSGTSAPSLLHGESELTVRVIRDVFNEDFSSLVVSGDGAWSQISDYVESVAPDLAPRLEKWTGEKDVFTVHRVDEQLAKALDRKVWLPSGGSLIIDRTEAMTVIDVNTGKFVGSGGNLEETVTKNNIEAAEEIVRQMRLRDIGGIIVVDFIDMVLEANRDLVVRRLLECLGRDRTKHQVAEVTSLGLVQMTRKRVGSGLLEIFSEPCETCQGRGVVVHDHPVEKQGGGNGNGGGSNGGGGGKSRRGRGGKSGQQDSGREGGKDSQSGQNGQHERVDSNGRTPAQIAAAAHAAAVGKLEQAKDEQARDDAPAQPETPAAQGRSEQQDRSEAPAAGQSQADAGEPAEPVRRPRRRRGRVVAPAGPPGAAKTAEGGSTDADQDPAGG